MKHWHLLHINPNLAETLQNPPILAVPRNSNLRDIIGTKLNKNGKAKRKSTNNIQGKCTPCLANNRILYCKQVINTTTFRNNLRNRIFKIHHNLNCKSLLECIKCKIQYIGKTETEFSIRLDNHQRDV